MVGGGSTKQKGGHKHLTIKETKKAADSAKIIAKSAPKSPCV